MRSSGRGTSRLFLAFLCTGWYDERMKKRVAYYVSRKNPLIWLAALVMLASAALRIANVCGKGADARTVWLLVVLPVTACVFYVLNILCNGKDRFYRSSIPVFLLAIYYGIKVTLVSPYLWLTFVFWIAYLAIAAFYAVTVSGHVKSTIPLLLLLLLSLLAALRLYLCAPAQVAGRQKNANDALLVWYRAAEDALLCMGIAPLPGEAPASFLWRAQGELHDAVKLTGLGKALCVAQYSGRTLKRTQPERAQKVYAALFAQMTPRQKLRLFVRRFFRGIRL